MATMLVTYRVRTGLAGWWVRAMRLVQFVVGRQRAEQWAIAGARRMLRVRIVSVKKA